MAPTTLREYLQTTEDAISSGRVDEALANCQHILTHFPDALEAQRLLGEVYLAQGQLEEAQQTFDWVLTNDPENVVAYCSRALISERLSDYDTALDCYQQAYELSRGNSQIRQQFNQLSEKAGQQGFIFSRAGLARLYMRGDLLPQAIQEWETVLTVTSERLDARLGLLETYWREGLYDRVEQLANQLLNDVPGCLKALLLLAHVIFAQNALQAQELMQQAKALDPDLVMARELFSDFIASQPKAPFLKLLRATPAVFPETSNTSKAEITSAASLPENASNGTSGTLSDSAFSEPLVHWNSLDNILENQQDYQEMQEASPTGIWNSNGSAEPNLWRSMDEQERQLAQEEPMPTIQSSSSTPEAEFDTWETLDQDVKAQHELEAEPWYMQQDVIENDDSAAGHEQAALEQSWYPAFEETKVDSWSNIDNIDSSAPNRPWEAETQETELPAPPAWLDMLTKGDRQPSSGGLPAQSSSTTPPVEQEPLTFIVKTSPQQNSEPAFEAQMPVDKKDHQTEVTPSQPAQEDDEAFFFGPAWLKSLGATTIDSESPEETETPAPAPSLVESSQQAVLEPAQEVTPSAQSEAKQKTSVESWLDQAAKKLGQPNQNLFTTLEELENDLRTQGFTQLEPGTLSTLANEQEPTLSSALAQLGNFGPQATSEGYSPQPSQTEMAPSLPPVEPLWPATPQVLPQAESQPQPVASMEQVPATPTHLDALARYVSNSTPSSTIKHTPETAQPVHADALSSLVSNTVPSPNVSSTPEAYSALSLESELETTMKRPAVRLQPMQRPSAQYGQAITRGRSTERSAPGKAADGGLSYKERLLKGYQYQLAGAYDDAMQEYRVIIRNAPEFLGDVVSNMRALLKLAPKYSAGYRVLGDAYMRQGEYLQAMEAYNKALTMAKKARG